LVADDKRTDSRPPRVRLSRLDRVPGVPALVWPLEGLSAPHQCCEQVEDSEMRVLIADDDRQALGFLKGCLTAWGHRVTTVHDGAAALAAIQSNSGITVAILNWMMPGMDGWRVSRRIKADRARQVRTILVVGAHFRSAAEEAFGSWADDYISKPFDLQDLKARLEAAV